MMKITLSQQIDRFMNNRRQGFTLIEVVITAAIVGLLAAIAMSSYRQHVIRANRSAVQTFVFSIANKEEQFLLDARKYFCTSPNTCTNILSSSTTPPLPYTVPTDVSKNYTITVDAPDATPGTYIITATPTGAQATSDTSCGKLKLAQDGAKTITGSGSVADCWK